MEYETSMFIFFFFMGISVKYPLNMLVEGDSGRSDSFLLNFYLFMVVGYWTIAIVGHDL